MTDRSKSTACPFCGAAPGVAHDPQCGLKAGVDFVMHGPGADLVTQRIPAAPPVEISPAALLDQALIDWMVTFADTESGQDEQQAAYKRFSDAGGTLAYIANVRAMLAHLAAVVPELQPIASAPKNQRVFVFGKHEDGRDAFAIGWLDVCDNRWYYAPQGGLIVGWTPTHWMRVPVPAIPDLGERDDLPRDWEHPKWSEYRKVHCWRNHIGEEAIVIWETFSQAQKVAIALHAQELASAEEWE